MKRPQTLAGIDCGVKTVKAVVLKDGKIIGKHLVPAGTDTRKAVEEAYGQALRQAGCGMDAVEEVVATGAGKNEVPFQKAIVTEVGADARGAVYFFPDARTVIDVGAEEGRAVRIDERGRIVDFAINDKCAAGAGAFIEAMARALEVPLEQLGPLSLKSTRSVPINAQCVVFAESELVSMLHAKTPKPDMARAVHDAIAERIASMARRVGIYKEIVLVGGMARNPGFVHSLKSELQAELKIPEAPEFVGAVGAALGLGVTSSNIN